MLSEGKHTVQTPVCAASPVLDMSQAPKAGAVAKCGRAQAGKGIPRLGVSDSVFNAAFQWTGF